MYVDSVAWSGTEAAVTAIAPDATVSRARHVRRRAADRGEQRRQHRWPSSCCSSPPSRCSSRCWSSPTPSRSCSPSAAATSPCSAASAPPAASCCGSIRAESLALGLVASTLGLRRRHARRHRRSSALVDARWPERRHGRAVGPSLPWYAGALVVGLLVTVVAAWLPTRRARPHRARWPRCAPRPTPTSARAPAGSASPLGVAGRRGRQRAARGLDRRPGRRRRWSPAASPRSPACCCSARCWCPALIRLAAGAGGRSSGRRPGSRPATPCATRGGPPPPPRRSLVGVTLTTAVADRARQLARRRRRGDGRVSTRWTPRSPRTDAPLRPDLVDDVRRHRRRRPQRRASTAPPAGSPVLGDVTVLGGRRRRRARAATARRRPEPGEVLAARTTLATATCRTASTRSPSAPAPSGCACVGGEGWGEAALVAPGDARRARRPDPPPGRCGCGPPATPTPTTSAATSRRWPARRAPTLDNGLRPARTSTSSSTSSPAPWSACSASPS